MTTNITYYNRISNNVGTTIPLADVLTAIATDSEIQQATNDILDQYGEAIEQGFPDGKKPYQNAKLNTLQAVIFSGYIEDKSAAIPADFQHSGLVTLDIDGNGPEVQQALWEVVVADSSVHSAARSVSGALTGDFFANYAVEIPDTLPDGLDIKQLHKLYHDYIAAKLADRTGAQAPTGGNIKRLRYLAHDSDMYANEAPTAVKLADALQWKAERKKTRQRAAKKATGAIKKPTSAIEDAAAYAESKGYQFIRGQRHYFINTVAIRLNYLGVPQQVAEQLISTHYPVAEGYGNAISYPYKEYATDFGKGAHVLAQRQAYKQAAEAVKSPQRANIRLQQGEYLSEKAQYILSLLNEHHKLHLQAGTGSGKSYMAAVEMAKHTGRKIIIACSLNAKVAKDAEQYGAAAITGEILSISKHEAQQVADNSQVVLCSYEKAPAVVERYAVDNPIVFIDEAHSLSYSYRGAALSRMWAAVRGFDVIAMTGTPLPYLAAAGFFVVKVTNERPQIDWVLRNRKPGALASTAVEHIEKTDLQARRVVVLVQSVAQLEMIKELLVKRGKCKADEVAVLYSDNEVKAGREFQQLVSANGGGESFDDRVKVVLTTSVIGEGIDVYSSKDIDFVSVHREQKFNPVQVVQFADRWRTSKRKAYYTYLLEKDEGEAWQQGDNYKAELFFRLRLDHFAGRAKLYNRKAEQIDQRCADQRVIHTGTQYSEEERFVHRCKHTGRYSVCIPSLIAEAENSRAIHRTQDSAIKEMQTNYPYFVLQDERETVEAVVDADVHEAGEKLKNERDKAKEKLAGYIENDLDTLVYAVSMRTQDVQLKKQQHYCPILEDQAEQLISEASDLFGRFFRYAESAVKRLHKARELNIQDSDFQQISVQGGTMRPAEQVTKFLQGLRLHILFLLYMQDVERSALTVQQMRDAERLTAFLGAIKDHEGETLTARKVKHLADRHMGGRKKHTTKQAVELVRHFFDLEFDRDKKGKQKRIVKFCNIKQFLERENVRKKLPILQKINFFITDCTTGV